MPCPRRGYSPPKERSKLVADGEWDAKKKLIPRPVQAVAEKTAGNAVSPEGALPAERTKQACRGRGVGCEKQAYPPPGPGRGGKNGGECRVPGRGTPRRKNEASLVADGEWDAKKKLIPRLV